MMRHVAFFGLLTAFLCVVSGAQTQDSDCPTIEVTSSPKVIQAGQVVTLVANTSLDKVNERQRPYLYDWSVNAGTIESGQGTPSIVVRAPNEGSDPIIASLIISSGRQKCNAVQSKGVEVYRRPISDPDMWGPLSFNDEKARIYNAALVLKANPTLKMFFLRYLPKVRNADRVRVKKLSDLLVKFGVRRNQFQFVFATGHEPLTVVLVKPPDFDPSQVK